MLTGLLLVCLAGAMAGLILAPAKLMRTYRFENYWLIYSLSGTVAIPWLLAAWALPDLPGFLAGLSGAAMVTPGLFALSWGVASTLGGLAVARIGLSLAYSLVIGLGAAAGTLVPLAWFYPQLLAESSGQIVIAGILVMVGGLMVVTKAGQARERQSGAAAAGNSRAFAAGVLMAVLAGVLASGLNFSFAFSTETVHAAERAGASGTSATYPVWALAMLGGMLPNLGFSVWKLTANRTWPIFRTASSGEALLGVLMGILFIGSTVVYGLGASRLGPLGTSIGWGIMQTTQIVVGNAAGFVTGEWRGVASGPMRLLFAGLALLILASAIMAFGNYAKGL